ncbi:MAG: hypothetical protein ACRDMX_18385 [Solirubrobacteraceae bacterium]
MPESSAVAVPVGDRGHRRPRASSHEDRLSPAPAVRALARLCRLPLNRRIVSGADPVGSPLLAARALQLACPATRRRIASALERLALSADRPLSAFATAPLRSAVAPNRDALLETADALRRPGPLYARGIAMLELILIDGSGPAYTDARGEGLTRQLQLAADWLAG